MTAASLTSSIFQPNKAMAEEISLDAAAVFLLLVATVLVVLPALRLEALAAAVVLEAEVLGAEAGA